MIPDWENQIRQQFPIGAKVHGRVTSISDGSITIELAPGIEGVLARQQLANGALRLGQWIDVIVSTLDPANHRIHLTQRPQ